MSLTTVIPIQDGSRTPVVRPFVLLCKVDMPEEEPKKVRLPRNLQALLQVATEALELRRPALQVFDESNNIVTDISTIRANSRLFISCAKPLEEEDQKPLFKQISHASKINVPPRKLPTIHHQPPKEPRADAQSHQAIATNPLTVKENIQEILLSIYSATPSDLKSKLDCKDAIEKLKGSYEQNTFERAMYTQFIGPTSSLSEDPLHQQAISFLVDRLKGIDVQSCQFAIVGPPQSGKSTILAAIASIFQQKLAISNVAGGFLFVPLNWSLLQVYLSDLPKIYEAFVETSIRALLSSRMNLRPIIANLKQWLLSAVMSSAFQNLPPQLLHFPEFPSPNIIRIGKTIYDAWNNPSGLEDFLKEMACLPNNLAISFGLQSAVYVFDHFDAAGMYIEGGTQFPQLEAPVLFSEALNFALEKCPFFVASQHDKEFLQVFKIGGAKHVSTEKIISSSGAPELFVTKPSFTLTKEMCGGCPAYCAHFEKVCEIAKGISQEKGVKSHFSEFRSAVEVSKKEVLREEIVRLTLLLSTVDSRGVINDDLRNELIGQKEVEVVVH